MQSVPPIDTELDNGKIDDADKRQDRPSAVAPRGIVKRTHQRDVAKIQQEQHEDRR